MKTSFCGADCAHCAYGEERGCQGCVQSGGCPFGERCFIAREIAENGMESYRALKEKLIAEFNALDIEGMPPIDELFALNGGFVNLAYPTPSGEKIKLLNDNAIYLGNQAESLTDEKKCFGLVADKNFLLVSRYGAMGGKPQIVLYKKR